MQYNNLSLINLNSKIKNSTPMNSSFKKSNNIKNDIHETIQNSYKTLFNSLNNNQCNKLTSNLYNIT